MAVLATRTPEDGILGAVAPLGLASAQATCLVIDLDPKGPNYPGERSLSGLVEDGPTRQDLEPDRPGLAVLRNGGIAFSEAAETVAALVDGWPAAVLRLPAVGLEVPYKTCVVRPLLPGDLFGPLTGDGVYQRAGWSVRAPSGSIVLPVPRPTVFAALFAGVTPVRSAWVKAWREVWGRSWA